MRVAFKFCLFAAAALMVDVALALTCTKCNCVVLPTDTFCAKCGADVVVPSPSSQSPLPQPKPVSQSYEYRSYEQSWTSPSTDLPFYQGMGRGLVTVCGSPIECVRLICVTWTGGAHDELSVAGTKGNGGSSINGGDLGVLGAAVAVGFVAGVTAAGLVAGTVSAVGDVGVGTLDFLTFGVVGDAVWKDRKKSPYFWQRRWSGGSRGEKEVGGAIF